MVNYTKYVVKSVLNLLKYNLYSWACTMFKFYVSATCLHWKPRLQIINAILQKPILRGKILDIKQDCSSYVNLYMMCM
jgi:hypothetical protein